MNRVVNPLSDEITSFVSGGVSLFAASRDASLQPWMARVGAVLVGDDRRTLTVFVPDRAGAELIAVLAPGAPLAVTATQVPTHRSVQLKGIVTGMRPAVPEERRLIEARANGFTGDLGDYGFPLPIVRRFVVWPATAVEMRIARSFEQTPGPGAGGPVAA